VIPEVDDALRALVAGAGRDASKAACSFDPPTPDWAAEVKRPTVNLFLLDVRENLEARAGDWADVRDDTGRLVGRRPPLRRYDLRYVVSVWGGTVEAQRVLFDALLAAVPTYDTLPPELLTGTLADQEIAVRLRIAQDDLGVSVVDLWSALGQPPCTTVTLVVTAPLLPAVDTVLAPPASTLDIGLAGRRPRPGRPPVPDLEEVEPVARNVPADEEGRPQWTKFRVRERSGE
jgi:hypothetical protein